MPNQPIQFLIGVDIGGTFTDIVVVDQISGKQFNGKILTTPINPYHPYNYPMFPA